MEISWDLWRLFSPIPVGNFYFQVPPKWTIVCLGPVLQDLLRVHFSVIAPLSTNLTFSSHPSHWNVLKQVPIIFSLLSISSKKLNCQTHMLSITTSPPQQNSILVFSHLLQINLHLLRLHKILSLTPSMSLFWFYGAKFYFYSSHGIL